jgi:hypothetical protein
VIRDPVLHELPDDPVAVFEEFYERGWCDGLPIIPPTPERVAAMLAGVEEDPQTVVGTLLPSRNEATIEKIAVNAVMAGCLPGSVPVLAAAVRGIAAPAFRLLTVGTPPSTPAMLLNGPIRRELDVNCSFCAMGGITRANATLGRALRLICLNIGNAGARTILDQATHGLPTRISFCFGENEEANPWEPFHVENGFAADESTVTVINVVTPLDILEQEAQGADGLTTTFAGSMTYQGSNHMVNGLGKPFVVLGIEHAALLAREGLSKDDFRRMLWEKSWLPLDRFPPEMRQKFEIMARPIVDGRVYLCGGPADLQIVVAGGFGPRSLFFTVNGIHQINAVGG